MHTYTIIADDLTGACDTGAAFALQGWQTRVAFSARADFGGARVRVLTTESRALVATTAAQFVEQAVFDLRLSAFSRIYKKIDSTLRGHPGAELAALMQAAQIKTALVAPAFPQQGRVVRDGQVWVHGARLAETEFARDLLQPDLLRLFAPAGDCRRIGLEDIRRQFGRMVEVIQRPGVTIADAETEDDLRLLAQAARRAGVGLLCGSAGLARAIVETLPPAAVPQQDFQPGGKPVLVVAGSRSPVTSRQVEVAERNGSAILPVEFSHLRIAANPKNPLMPAEMKDRSGGPEAGEESDAAGQPVHADALLSANASSSGETLLSAAMERLSAGANVILRTSETERVPGVEGQIAVGLSHLAARILAAGPVGGLVLTGGETAAAVFRALGCAAFDLGGEVQPGVVWGRLADGAYAGLPVVTKAGGFGEDDTLLTAVRFLRS